MATVPSPPLPESSRVKRPQGFASLDPAARRRVASEGGKAAHAYGRAHQFTAEEARAAGRKGGRAKRSTTSAVEAGRPFPDSRGE